MNTRSVIRGVAAAGFALVGSAALAQECEPSKWGADDEIGSANLITPERVRLASQLVERGISRPLGVVIDSNTPAFPPRSLNLQVVQPNQQGGQKLTGFGYEGNYNDDLIQTWVGIGSQLDGLGHLGENGMYYNCLDEKEIAPITGLTKLGTHAVPPLVGRAVILDMAAHFGKDFLEAGESWGSAEMMEAAEAQGVEMGEGDIILIHTGWTDAKYEADPQAWVSGEPGPNNEGMAWLASLNPLAIGADTWGVEPVPAPEGDRVFYGHVITLMQHGIYLLETMNTGPVLEDGVNEFLFVLGQARIRGTVQAMINPVALY
ncbi:MAG: cyclase family protein [Pseudomonadota bacterium]